MSKPIMFFIHVGQLSESEQLTLLSSIEETVRTKTGDVMVPIQIITPERMYGFSSVEDVNVTKFKKEYKQ